MELLTQKNISQKTNRTTHKTVRKRFTNWSTQ